MRHAHEDGQAEAAADLVKALSAHNAGQLDVAAGLARAARDGLQPHCPTLAEAAAQRPRSGKVAAPAASPATSAAAAAPATTAARCDHRIAWQPLLILQHHAVDTGDWVGATQHAKLARELAAAAGDDSAWPGAPPSWPGSARAATASTRQCRCCSRHSAWHSARPTRCCWPVPSWPRPRVAAQRHDLEGMRRLAEQALPLAQQAASPRLEAAV